MSESIEKEMLKDFIDELKHRQQKYYNGQGNDNRIKVNNKVSFQFGDLRIDTDKYHIIIEVESSGGITNLAKYWYAIEKGKITKTVILLHIYKKQSKNDYASHEELWDFIYDKMNEKLNNKIIAKRFDYKDGHHDKNALVFFKSLLDGQFHISDY